MSTRPTELELSLAAIDEAFSDAVKQAYRDLQVYAPGAGVGPKTPEEARQLARDICIEARRRRNEAIALVTDVLSD